MERGRMDLSSSELDLEREYEINLNLPGSSPAPLQSFAAAGSLSQVSESNANAAYFSWPACRISDAAEDRAHYFGNLQKGVLPEIHGRRPTGLQATTLLELMTIRAFHSKLLRRFSLGTAIGLRIRGGYLTDIPAILVFVGRKVNRKWLNPAQCLPAALEGPGGVWCEVDVVEFSYYGAPAATPKEQFYTELVDGFGGSDPCIGSGSQVASQETYGTLGAIVRSRTGNRQVGFLTNRHVAVDLDFPSQKMFHPLPPCLGPGVYLGAVERATSFISDDRWYGTFAGTNPETFVRADGAFIPFAEDFNMANVTTLVKGIGEIGGVNNIDLQSPVDSLVGRQVVKAGRSSGLTTGTIMAYSLEYNDEKGMCYFTDFLVVGEDQQTFDLEGDSGSLILLTATNGDNKPRPVGIIWGGTANRGRLKLKPGQPPENWTSGVDLGRLLDLLELDVITSAQGLQAALQDQRSASGAGDSTVGESSPIEWGGATKDKSEENFELHGLSIPQASSDDDSHPFEVHRLEVAPVVEHQFITSFSCESPANHNHQNQTSLCEPVEEISVSLQLGEPECKRRRRLCDSPPGFNNSN
ncbi:Trypsin family protein [Perilla frutescens var. hirtella]|nr:Trypsin family protein [Perilla frutescens var. hirtella]